MRIMGLDYGDKTVGVAISDAMLLTAQPIETIERERPSKLRKTLARLENLMAEYEIETVVIGLPKRLNNEEGERCEQTRAFGDRIAQRTGLQVVYQDERLSTVEAEAVLQKGNVRKERHKQYVDKMAASIILQGYLDTMAHREESTE